MFEPGGLSETMESGGGPSAPGTAPPRIPAPNGRDRVGPANRRVLVETAERPAAGFELPRTAPPRLVLGSRLLSIRVPLQSAIVSCELCANLFSAHGPTGYYEEQPICDRCLLEQESQLGMLLALSIFTRTYARLADQEGEIGSAAACEMLAFARIYELFAARFGPSRPLDFNAFSAIGTIR